MSSEMFGLILDILILIFLGAMIFYAMRLSNSLNVFRSHRQEFDKIISSLVNSIAQAERSVQSLKDTGQSEAAEMKKLIKEARALSEELQIINEAGENMAKRMEKLAEKNRKIVQGIDPDRPDQAESSGSRARGGLARTQQTQSVEPSVEKPVKRPIQQKQPVSRQDISARAQRPVENIQRDDDLPSFMIKDRDYSKLGELEEKLESSASNDYVRGAENETEDMPDHLQSQAERELYEALRLSGRPYKSGGRRQ